MVKNGRQSIRDCDDAIDAEASYKVIIIVYSPCTIISVYASTHRERKDK